MEVGSVSAVIVKHVTDNPSVTLIVMGAAGSTGIAGLFGSTTGSVVIKTTTPVLIVPLESKFSPDPVITLASDFASKLSSEDVSRAPNELIEGFWH